MNNFISKFFRGTVTHARVDPVGNAFEYPVAWYSIDVDELPLIDQNIFGFGYNRFSLCSIHDIDYLFEGTQSIRVKVEKILNNYQIRTIPQKIILITTPKILGWAFNPVSFYYLYDSENHVFCYFAEVNNTYEERSLYVFPVDSKTGSIKEFDNFKVNKHFHVSPFYDETGHYDVYFSELTDKLDIRFNLHRKNEKPFIARMWGQGESLSKYSSLAGIIKFGKDMALTLPRIYWQAIQLMLVKKLKPNIKPNPIIPSETSKMKTLRANPYKLYDQVCIYLVKKVLRMLKVGQLRFIYPDGSTEYYGDASSNYIGEIHIKSFNFFKRLFHSGGIGFGESYVENEWTTPDLAKVLKVVLDNDRHMHESRFNYFKPLRWINRFNHWLRRNSKLNSKKNISDHYDLGNKMFSLFLDPTMAYSSAVFKSPDEDLHTAQLNKLHAILDKAKIKEGDNVLEIGCGWGELAAIAAKDYNAHVTGITLSTEQAEIANEKLKNRNLSDKVQIQLRDYRDVVGQYDKVVSVEMIEAVGKEYLGSFFKTIDRVLAPNGICVLQVIAYADPYYEEYLGRQDWIQKHIFPGSHLPSLTSLLSAMTNNSNLVVDSIENRAADYALTLKIWREKFNLEKSNLEQAGYDERFQRAWNFYLAACEAEFDTRWLSLYQIVLTRPNNRDFNRDNFISEKINELSESEKMQKQNESYMH